MLPNVHFVYNSLLILLSVLAVTHTHTHLLYLAARRLSVAFDRCGITGLLTYLLTYLHQQVYHSTVQNFALATFK